MNTLFLCLLPLAALAQDFGATWGTAHREAAYYRLVDIPMPEGVYVEAGNVVSLPDGRLAVGTRRGEILLFSGVAEERPQPRVARFASGLDEVLGLAWRDGAFYATHAAEITRIADTNGDGRADRFDTVSDAWGFGHYHEYALGSKFDAEGNLYVALGCPNPTTRKRCFALKSTPDGKTIPLSRAAQSAGRGRE